MLNHRSGVVRYAIAPTVFAAMLALAPAAAARVRVGIDVNIALPPHVHVNIGNYEPYYIGRVFYQPAQVWRPVYSFPVETPYGVAYSPYVYDGGRVVCHDYIPGIEAGYGQFVIEGRGRYNPQWYRGGREYHAYNRYEPHHDHGWHGRDDDHQHGNAHGRGDHGHGHDRR